MDLKTMRAKVNKNKYKSFDEFKKDVDQIICNCMTFNAGNDHFLKIGVRFEQDCKKIFQKNKDKIQNLEELIKKLTEVNARNSGVESSENSQEEVSNKSNLKKRKARLKSLEKNEESSNEIQ